MKIRFASPADGASLSGIYARYIRTPVTFECSLPDEREFARRIADVMCVYPYLVCEEEETGRVAGYAYAHRHMEREAYGWNAELSVYLDPDFTSGGWGKRLYGVLMEILRLQGVRTVYGGVTLPNPASERLHGSLGFRRIGVYRNAGYKCGRWHDVAWFEKEIGPYAPAPEPVVPVWSVPPERLKSILEGGGKVAPACKP